MASLAPVADAIALLLRPHAEVVLHDLASGNIAHVAGGFSRRATGDSSLADLADIATIDRPVIGPYPKTNSDGRHLKSVTAVLRGGDGTPAGLVCINLDISMFEALQSVARSFLFFGDETHNRPAALFRNDWREDVNEIVGQFLADHATTPGQLTARERGDLVTALDARGLFEVRNGTPYIASLLSLSRATLYKILKSVRAASPS